LIGAESQQAGDGERVFTVGEMARNIVELSPLSSKFPANRLLLDLDVVGQGGGVIQGADE
jgi:hypothetical protein